MFQSALNWSHSYPIHFLMAAVLGLVVNVLGVIIIKLSSATTLKVRLRLTLKSLILGMIEGIGVTTGSKLGREGGEERKGKGKESG